MKLSFPGCISQFKEPCIGESWIKRNVHIRTCMRYETMRVSVCPFVCLSVCLYVYKAVVWCRDYITALKKGNVRKEDFNGSKNPISLLSDVKNWKKKIVNVREIRRTCAWNQFRFVFVKRMNVTMEISYFYR